MSTQRGLSPHQFTLMSGAHKRGAGKGGFAVLWHDGRAWPALPDRERSVKSMRSIVIALSLIVLPWSWACAEVQFTNVVKASLVFREESIPSGDYPHLLRVFLCLENQHDSDESWVCNSTEVEAEVLDRAGKPVPCPPSLSSIHRMLTGICFRTVRALNG